MLLLCIECMLCSVRCPVALGALKHADFNREAWWTTKYASMSMSSTCSQCSYAQRQAHLRTHRRRHQASMHATTGTRHFSHHVQHANSQTGLRQHCATFITFRLFTPRPVYCLALATASSECRSCATGRQIGSCCKQSWLRQPQAAALRRCDRILAAGSACPAACWPRYTTTRRSAPVFALQLLKSSGAAAPTAAAVRLHRSRCAELTMPLLLPVRHPRAAGRRSLRRRPRPPPRPLPPTARPRPAPQPRRLSAAPRSPA
jgi:hypothetical protein